MTVSGKPNKQTKAFINYMLGEKVQKDLVPKIGYLSINEMKVTRNSKNQVTQIGK